MFKDEAGEVVADLQSHGDLYVAARGGAGGHGNYFFLSNELRAPTTYEMGGVGEERILSAELRVMAHIAHDQDTR
jgi:GTP-binding protein